LAHGITMSMGGMGNWFSFMQVPPLVFGIADTAIQRGGARIPQPKNALERLIKREAGR
jgi:hypothetical protein